MAWGETGYRTGGELKGASWGMRGKRKGAYRVELIQRNVVGETGACEGLSGDRGWGQGHRKVVGLVRMCHVYIGTVLGHMFCF